MRLALVASLTASLASAGCWSSYVGEPAVAGPGQVGYAEKVDMDQWWGDVYSGIGTVAQTPPDGTGPSLDSIWRCGIDELEFCVFSTDGRSRCANALFDAEPDGTRPMTIVEVATRTDEEARMGTGTPAAGGIQPPPPGGGLFGPPVPQERDEAVAGTSDDPDTYVHVPPDRAVWVTTGTQLYRCALESQGPICRSARL
jgi:hypothetical protein